MFSKCSFLLNHSFNIQMETLGNSSWTELLGKYLRTQGKTVQSLGSLFLTNKTAPNCETYNLIHILLVGVRTNQAWAIIISTQVMMTEQHCNSSFHKWIIIVLSLSGPKSCTLHLY